MASLALNGPVFIVAYAGALGATSTDQPLTAALAEANGWKPWCHMVPLIHAVHYNSTATLSLGKQQIIHLYLSLKRVSSLAIASVIAAMSHSRHFSDF